jgi:hypothetical protein
VKALLVALLLVLAISPLTAPFSVHTPLDAMEDLASWSAPKKVADDLKTDAVPSPGIDVPGVDWSLPERPASTSRAHGQQQDRFPLRV